MSDAPTRRINPRLDLPEADFVALKIRAAETGVTLRDLFADTIAAWLDSGAPPAADLPPIAEPFVRTNVSLPEPVHLRLKVRAATERATMQALMRSALAPLLAAGAPPPCRVIAVVNPRAGVGRTTLALGLGRAIAAGGQRTLLVDLDPEAGLTRAAGVEPAALEATVADLLAPGQGGPPRPGVLLRPLGERLALLPAGPALARAELELLLAGGRERALTEALRPVLGDYDVALLDCPPSLGLLTLLALVAADQALVPVAPGEADAREVGGLLAALDRLRASRRAPRLASTGVVVTQGGGKTAALVAMLAALAGEGEGEATAIIGEAPAATAPGAAGRGYAAIADQLFERP
jgi:chromosome partitioning protein